MSIPTLATKLYIPVPPPKVVLRPRLVERLNEGLCQEQGSGQKLTLISAPAGFGKTTLLSEWIPGCKRSVAWLSLDEGDNDLARFLVYVVAALQTIVPNIGEQVLGVLQNPQPPPTESILTTLLNEIEAIPNDFVFILDDYHVIDAQAVDNALTFLIEHMPQQMHLVITTREDPNLPIPRLRSRGQLTELRAADLRFTPAEAAEFLNRAMSLHLSDEDIGVLDTRTEGWIAGLQLAALSMKDHQDIPGFIRAFAGDHGYIVDYLIEEVLKRQPESVRSFLIQTAILARLNGPLCDAVTGQPGGKTRLETLQRGNFFIIPLDDKRYWYRYHHLFADVLQAQLMTEQPDQVPILHLRASLWYEQNGSTEDAIRHALVGQDFDRAASLMELAFPAMSRNRQEVILLGWLKALPETLVRERPMLCDLYAGVLLQTGKMDGVEDWLQAAERWLDPAYLVKAPPEQPEVPSGKMVVVDDEEFRRLPGSIAVHRAGQALLLGHVADTILYARRALDLIPDNDNLGRGGALGLLGLASWAIGDLDTAGRFYKDSMASLLQAGHTSDAIGLSISLADIQLAQGRLTDSLHTYKRGLQLAAEKGQSVLRGAADMHVGMSEIYRERNDFQSATQNLLRSKELGELKELGQNPYRWRVVMARIRAAQGDLDGALDLLNEAESVYMGDFSPNVRPVPALRARVWIRMGRLGEALSWAREQGLSTRDDLRYSREFEHITLARILLAQQKIDGSESLVCEAIGLLERLLKAAEEGGRTGSAIEILTLQALAHQQQGDLPAALSHLERALTLAEPEGYVRIFLDEGASMAQLIEIAAEQGIMPDYTGKLLPAFDSAQHGLQAALPHAASPAPSSLIEPLSQRELEILRLFKTELSGPEIAQELVIALSTVRTHTKSIYGKLNVNSRRGAVQRATELNLV